jgi:hypothetical protein
MSNKIKGTVLVSGQIAPSHENDLYPTHEDIFGKGGYSVVNDIADRDAISDERRKEGMAVYVKEVDGKDETVAKVYVLQGGIENANWVEWPFGGGGPGAPENLQVTLDTGAQFNGTDTLGGKFKINYGVTDIDYPNNTDGFRIEDENAPADKENITPLTLIHAANKVTEEAEESKEGEEEGEGDVSTTITPKREISITSQDNTNYNDKEDDKGITYTSLKVNPTNIVVESHNNADLDSPAVGKVLAVKSVSDGEVGQDNKAHLHWADAPVVEPEIVTVKHTLDATDIVGISKPDGGSPYVLLPLQKESTTFYNIINIHCRFDAKGSTDGYNINGGDGDLIAMYFSTLNNSTGSIIPPTLLQGTGDDIKTFAYGNPLADPARDNNVNSSWLPVDDFVIYSDYSIDDAKSQAIGELEIWVTYTLTSLT